MKRNKTNHPFTSCIIAAGGSGKRMGTDCNKLFFELGGAPVLAHTLMAFEENPMVDEIIVSAKTEDFLYIKELAETFDIRKLKTIVKGGAERAESVKAALLEVSDISAFVLVHDGARPLVDQETITRTISAAYTHGAAACGVRPKNTIKREDENGFIAETVDRSELYEIQTPQVFSKDLFSRAYQADGEMLRSATDDCSLVERLGVRVKIVAGNYRNIKITTAEDILIAEVLREE